MTEEVSGNVPLWMIGAQGAYGEIEEEDLVNLLEQYYGSSISSMSQEEKNALIALTIASNPTLATPESFAMMVEEGESEMISAMLDSWLDNIEKQAERAKEEQRSPRFQAWLEQQSPAFWAKVERDTPSEELAAIRGSSEYKGWLNTLPPSQRQEEVENNTRIDLMDGISNYIGSNRDEVDAAPFMTAAFVIAAGFIGDYMNVVDVASSELVAANPIQNAGNISHVLPPDLQETMHLTINLFVVGTMYHATAEAIAKNEGKPVKDLEFAENFALDVIDKVNSNEINTFLMSLLVHKNEGGEPISSERMSQLATVAKLVMLTLSLALVYQVTTGGISGQEMADLINGKMEPGSEVEAQLVANIRGQLGQLPAEEREAVLIGLMAFLDSKPSVEDLLDPKKAYEGVVMEIPKPQPRG